MPQSPMRDIGPCSLNWKGADLGESLGDVMFRPGYNFAQVKENSKGDDSVDEILIGMPVELECPLTRFTMAILASVTPGASGSGTSGDTVTVRNAVGLSLYDIAGLMVVKPIVNGVASTDSSEWLYCFKAAPKPQPELVYNVDGQRVYLIVFKVFPVQAGAVHAGDYYRWGPAI